MPPQACLAASLKKQKRETSMMKTLQNYSLSELDLFIPFFMIFSIVFIS
jgi:hypothetical protein